MILADTKFEFGTDASGRLFLIDEILNRIPPPLLARDQVAVGQFAPS